MIDGGPEVARLEEVDGVQVGDIDTSRVRCRTLATVLLPHTQTCTHYLWEILMNESQLDSELIKYGGRYGSKCRLRLQQFYAICIWVQVRI